MILKQKSRPTFSIWTFLGCPFSKNFLDFLKMDFVIFLYNKCPEGLKDAPPPHMGVRYIYKCPEGLKDAPPNIQWYFVGKLCKHPLQIGKVWMNYFYR